MKTEKLDMLFNLIIESAPSFRKSFGKLHCNHDSLKLSPHEHYCFMIINQEQEISMSELAVNLGVSSQQLTRIVTNLERHRLVNRVVGEKNKRLVYAKLTDQGRELFLARKLQMKNRIIEKLSALSEQDIDKSIEYLNGLKNIFSKLDDE